MKSVIDAMTSEYRSESGVEIRKSGNILIYSGAPTVSGSAQWVDIATISAPYKPKQGVYFVSGTYAGKLYPGKIDTSGKISVYVYDTVTNAQIFFSVVSVAN